VAVDEATSALLAQMAESGLKQLHEMTPQEARGFGGSLRQFTGTAPRSDR